MIQLNNRVSFSNFRSRMRETRPQEATVESAGVIQEKNLHSSSISTTAFLFLGLSKNFLHEPCGKSFLYRLMKVSALYLVRLPICEVFFEPKMHGPRGLTRGDGRAGRQRTGANKNRDRPIGLFRRKYIRVCFLRSSLFIQFSTEDLSSKTLFLSLTFLLGLWSQCILEDSLLKLLMWVFPQWRCWLRVSSVWMLIQ